MRGVDTDLARPPSRWWIALAAICATLTFVAVIGAVVVQREASKLTGEGEIFLADSGVARDLVGTAESIDLGVREARNRLRVEAASAGGAPPRDRPLSDFSSVLRCLSTRS